MGQSQDPRRLALARKRGHEPLIVHVVEGTFRSNLSRDVVNFFSQDAFVVSITTRAANSIHLPVLLPIRSGGSILYFPAVSVIFLATNLTISLPQQVSVEVGRWRTIDACLYK